MGKTATHAVQFRDPFQPSLGPDRLMFVITCDDGAVYEFQRHEDSPIWNMRSRGSTRDDPRTWSQSRAPLPTDVRETLDTCLGKDNWTK